MAGAEGTILTEPTIAPFRARARLLALLGDQLIGSDQLAIFELVKNAYDADAEGVKVTLSRLKAQDPVITVEDSGDGMNLETITSIWLEPANDHREVQRKEGRRTRIFNRLPLGEKGVGRFAVHKLGRRIELITRPRGTDVEHRVVIDWDALTNVKYLDEAKVAVETRTPETFIPEKGRKPHGALIVISDLRKKVWRRGEARQLQRSITAISSPFASADAFTAHLDIPEHPEWLEDMSDVAAMLAQAPWRFEFEFDGSLKWNYTFTSPLGRRLSGRELSGTADRLLIQVDGSGLSPVADAGILDGIGAIKGELIAYDRDRKVMTLLPHSQALKQFLDNQGGVRVYRDGVRVYNYGEPSDDWLQLDLRRVNRPSQRLSRNLIVGAINLNLETSTALREKTNREGFDENDAFGRFRQVVTAIIHKFEVERALDKDRMKRLLEDASDKAEILVETPLRHLREAVAGTAQAAQIMPIVDRVEAEYVEMRDLLLRAGMSGLNLGIIIHEVEKGVRGLYDSVRHGSSGELLEKQSRNLMSLIESVGGLLREKDKSGVDLREMVQTMAAINVRRFRRHQIQVSYDLPTDVARRLKVPGSSALLQNVLMNLVDNAIYWLRVRWPDQADDTDPVRRLHVSLTEDLPGGPALVVSDNGPGFQDVPEVATKPFFTRRPDGIGLGLYYSSLAMSLANGSLSFPEPGDVGLPDWADGAVVAMHFSGYVE